MDKRVEVHGTGRADMDGKYGVATDFEGGPQLRLYLEWLSLALYLALALMLMLTMTLTLAMTMVGVLTTIWYAADRTFEATFEATFDRYTVQLDSGEALKLKRANVRATGAGGGAGKAKKGKGKKGRKK
jgi:hypothetical protein